MPQGMAFTDIPLRRLLEQFGDEFREAGMLPVIRRPDNFKVYTHRVLFNPAHFAPANNALVSFWSDRLRLLPDFVERHFQIRSPPLIMAESAGTHTAVSIFTLLCGMQWKPSRVLLSAYAMPAHMMRTLLSHKDLSNFLFAVHTLDHYCLVPPLEKLQRLRGEYGANVLVANQADLIWSLFCRNYSRSVVV